MSKNVKGAHMKPISYVLASFLVVISIQGMHQLPKMDHHNLFVD